MSSPPGVFWRNEAWAKRGASRRTNFILPILVYCAPCLVFWILLSLKRVLSRVLSRDILSSTNQSDRRKPNQAEVCSFSGNSWVTKSILCTFRVGRHCSLKRSLRRGSAPTICPLIRLVRYFPTQTRAQNPRIQIKYANTTNSQFRYP